VTLLRLMSGLWNVLMSIKPMMDSAKHRKALRQSSCFEPYEPSAVDQLAALGDPDGEAAGRVARWKAREVALSEIASAAKNISAML